MPEQKDIKLDMEKKNLNPTKVIMEHIADSHMWHLWGHVSFPLPVIVYTPAGLDVFSSGHFHHGEHDYASAKNTYRLVDDKVKIVGADGKVDEAASAKLLDFSITKNVCGNVYCYCSYSYHFYLCSWSL